MDRNELEELHYLTPIANVPSILKLGILSHNLARRVQHESVAMNKIQERRSRVVVPGGKKLHDYANLYICSRNPMMYKRRDQHSSLCVLRIDPTVIDIHGVVITDGNASSNYAIFKPAPAGLSIVNRALTFADDWRDDDEIQYYRKNLPSAPRCLCPTK